MEKMNLGAVIDEVSILHSMVDKCRRIPYGRTMYDHTGDDHHMVYGSCHNSAQNATGRSGMMSMHYHAGYNRRGMGSVYQTRTFRIDRVSGTMNGTNVFLDTLHPYNYAVHT